MEVLYLALLPVQDVRALHDQGADSPGQADEFCERESEGGRRLLRGRTLLRKSDETGRRALHDVHGDGTLELPECYMHRGG